MITHDKPLKARFMIECTAPDVALPREIYTLSGECVGVVKPIKSPLIERLKWHAVFRYNPGHNYPDRIDGFGGTPEEAVCCAITEARKMATALQTRLDELEAKLFY